MTLVQEVKDVAGVLKLCLDILQWTMVGLGALAMAAGAFGVYWNY